MISASSRNRDCVVMGVGMADDVKALVHHVGIATVRVRVPSEQLRKRALVDPRTEGAPIVQQDLSGKPAM